MYTRMWWKDLKQFWPIWVFLVIAATSIQIMVLLIMQPDPKADWFRALGPLAMGWTCLYALAVGAAAFAGEREAGTLRLLDIIPVSRSVVWSSKVSFGFVSTIALAIVLLIVAMLGAAGGSGDSSQSFEQLLPLCIVVFEALGWGLLCSAILNNAVAAAVAAVCCTGVGWSSVMGGLDGVFLGGLRQISSVQLGFINFVVFLATIAISNLAFVRRWKFAGMPFQFQFRSPVVIASTGAPRSRRAPTPAALTTAATQFSHLGAAVRGLGPETIFHPGQRSRLAEAKALIWQTMREGRSTWFLLAFIGLVLPWLIAGRYNEQWIGVTSAVVALTAGVSVFGIENRSNTQRFMVHHGAQPGLVWLIKLCVWLFGLAVIFGTVLVVVFTFGIPSFGRPAQRPHWSDLSLQTFYELLALASIYLNIFSVAALCGMAIRRGITAWVLAMVAALSATIVPGALATSNMLPLWGVAVVPPTFLLISRLSSADWLFDRPALGRWIRLMSLLSVAVISLFGGYVAIRAWGVANSPPIPAPWAWASLTSDSIPPDRDAAPIYREANRLLGVYRKNDQFGIDPATGIEYRKAPEYELTRRQILSDLHQAAQRPECRFLDPSKLSVNSSLELPEMRALSDLVANEFQTRLDRGDLPGAWDEVEVIFAMAHHLSQLAIGVPALEALRIEQLGLERAQQWALDAHQTPERLRAAINRYPNLPKVVSNEEVVNGEAQWTERTIDRIDEHEIAQLKTSGNSEYGYPSTITILQARLISPPWERERARRINRQISAALIQLSLLEPFSRPKQESSSSVLNMMYNPRSIFTSSPLLRLFLPWTMSYLNSEDYNLVHRRALIQIMAIREWQLTHNGQFPNKLEDLVPSLLPKLPLDPYSGKPFMYVLRMSNSRMLYSFGLDERNAGGLPLETNRAVDDISFVIPPIETKPKPSAPKRPAAPKPSDNKPPTQNPKP